MPDFGAKYMIKFEGYEIGAVNSGGKWYATVFKDDKCVYSGVNGFTVRQGAIDEGERKVYKLNLTKR